ncbi:integrase [Nocardia sp. NPDC051052]|uniref:integrase n=1 Tax=Nocardia sp. NPDC051052 TaxID=3364322 RepID=UPI0037BA5E05
MRNRTNVFAASATEVVAGANVLALARLLAHKDAKDALNTYADLFDNGLDKLANPIDKAYAPSE